MLLAVLAVTTTAFAAPPGGSGRYDLMLYDPPRFQVDVWLGEPNNAIIEYDGRVFTVTTEFNRPMSPETLSVMADAIDFSVSLQEAMPQ